MPIHTKHFSLRWVTPGCVFVLAAVSEREQLPAQVTVPARAAATKKITISETRPGFEKRILEERPSQTRVSDNWFVLLEGDLKASGIFFLVWSFFVLCVAKKTLTHGHALFAS